MPRHRPDQSLSRGFTIAEMLVGVAVTAIVTGVLVGLLRAGIVSYRASSRSQFVMMNARRALDGDGPRLGLRSAVLQASSVFGSGSAIQVTLPSLSLPVEYDLIEGQLWRTQEGASSVQADGVARLGLSYYRQDPASGRLVAASNSDAALVTMALTVQGADRHPYSAFAGAKMRNAP